MHNIDEMYYPLEDGIGYVLLEDFGGSELGIINAARMSYANSSNSISTRDVELLRRLYTDGHHTPFEHTQLTFRVKCPIFIARQWMRHRIGSFNEKSLRYTKKKPEFYIEEGLFGFQYDMLNNDHNGGGCPENGIMYISDIIETLGDLYSTLIHEHKIAPEVARSVLPQCTYTEFYWTCNLRSFLHFLDLRMSSHAQKEIQLYSEAMLEQVSKIFPNIMKIYRDARV